MLKRYQNKPRYKKQKTYPVNPDEQNEGFTGFIKGLTAERIAYLS